MDGNIIMGSIAALFSCFLGSVIGAMIAFLRARYLMRDLIYLFAKRYPLVRAADRALKRKGFRIMLLFRLCPLIPFNALNYCCGITGTPWFIAEKKLSMDFSYTHKISRCLLS